MYNLIIGIRGINMNVEIIDLNGKIILKQWFLKFHHIWPSVEISMAEWERD